MRKLVCLVFALLFLLTGCELPLNSLAQPTTIPISDLLLNHNQQYPPTPTPFQPIPPTSVPLPTQTPTPKPTKTPDVPVFSARPEGQVNILLLGSDQRKDMGFRTDTILLLSLNPKDGTATLTSFPRDLYVAIPGIGYERINTSQAYGGFMLTQATFSSNFGVPVDYYMMTNFSGFTNIIDTLGGITVNAASTLTDTCSLPQEWEGYCTVYAGPNEMNGTTALWYVRSRYSSSDFDRTRRAQEVIQALFLKMVSLDALNRANELYNQFQSSVETNIPLDTIIKLLPVASQLATDASRVQRFAIGASETYSYIVPATGAMVLIPDAAAVSIIIQKALFE